MKVEQIIVTKKTQELEITGATLLSNEEAKSLPLELRKYENYFWWTRSAGQDATLVACVDGEDFTNDLDLYIYDIDVKVRPALQIQNLYTSNLKIGDRFMFGKKLFQIISNELAFCLSDIGMHCFRENWKAKDSNDYEKSDIKKYIDEWFETACHE